MAAAGHDVARRLATRRSIAGDGPRETRSPRRRPGGRCGPSMSGSMSRHRSPESRLMDDERRDRRVVTFRPPAVIVRLRLRKVGCRPWWATCEALSTQGCWRNQILHGVHIRHFDDPPCPVHAAEGAADVPSFAEQLRRCGWNGDRTVGTHLPSIKALEPESSRFNLGDGEVIEFQGSCRTGRSSQRRDQQWRRTESGPPARLWANPGPPPRRDPPCPELRSRRRGPARRATWRASS